VFSASYTPGLLDIYYNGSHLSNGDFTANNGTFITLATGSAEGDILDVFVYTYQVGAFSGIGGEGVANEISYFNTTNSITSSAAITISGANAIITGSLLGTASYAANANLLDGLDSSVFVPTGSFNTFSSSILTYTGSADSRFSALETTSGSNITRISALESASGSAITRLSALETASGRAITRLSSIESTTGSLNAASGSAITRLSSLESKTGSYATTGSNIFVEGQYLSSSYNPTGFSTTASLYTDGGLRVSKDAYISGTLYLNNVTVYGTQSVCYITSSQLNIASNLITVNNATPSVQFGGLAVYDSGSTGLTGSILWDSQNNHWVYSNPSGSSYSGGMFISGPRAASLGSETGTTACMLLAGQGGDHLTSSMIYHSNTVTCIPNALLASGCVGIGTPTPYSNLHVAGTIKVATGNAQGILGLGEGNGATVNVGLWRGAANAPTSDGNYLNLGGYDGIVLATGNAAIGSQTERMRIESGGDIRINMPNSTQRTLSWYSANGTYQVAGIASCTHPSFNDAGYLIFSTAKTSSAGFTEKMRIDPNGNVGIATTSPASFFQIGTYASSGKYVDNATLPNTPGNYLITLTPPSTTNYYGGGIGWSEGTNTAAAINAFDDGATGALGLSISTGTNSCLAEKLRITSTGAACFACELTAKTLGTNDLILNNLNYECANYVDGTRGSWLIQEGACDLFIINQVSCKKYKFNLIEIK
jgi:hypothetical protein